MSKFSAFTAVWAFVLITGAAGLYQHSVAGEEDARIDAFIAAQAKSPDGDDGIASMAVFRDRCQLKMPLLMDKMLVRYEHVRGAAFAAAKSKKQEDFANPFAGLFVMALCPILQKFVDEATKRLDG